MLIPIEPPARTIDPARRGGLNPNWRRRTDRL